MNWLKFVFWNPVQARVRAGWRVVIQTAAAMGIMFGSLRLLSVVWIVPEPDADAPLAVFMCMGALTLLATILSVGLAGRFLDRRRFSDFGLNIDKVWWLDFLFGLMLGALLIGLVFAIEMGAGWIRIVETFHTAPGRSFAGSIVVFAGLFVSIGIAEELMSRGYHIRNLAEGLRSSRIGDRQAILLAWVISSTVFGLFHITNPDATLVSTVNIIVAGITLGTAYVITGQLTA